MPGHVATLLADPREREQRSRVKRERILRWLRANTWSTADVLRQVAGLGTRQAAHTLLTGLARDQMLRHAEIKCEYGPPVRLWGITAHGAAIAAAPDEPVHAKTFEPSKVNPATLTHALDLQRLQLRAEAAGWAWKPIDGEYSRSTAKYPDSIGIRPDGQRVAIEVERTVKTSKRYAEILVAHLAARKEGKWNLIYYLCPEEAIRNRVERVFKEISRANWRGKPIKIEGAHRAPFRFFTYDGNWLG